MPVQFDTLENGSIVLVTFIEPWMATEMIPAFEADQAHRDAFQEQHPGKKVHLIADLSQAKIAAKGTMSTRKSPSLTHPTSGMVVIVGANMILQTMANVVFRLSHYDRALFVESMDEALDSIRKLES